MVLNLSYQRKKQMLFVLLFGLFLFIFYRGFELHLVKPITDRIRWHAIPVAISVLYHGHPHNYTGLREIEMPFQGTDSNANLLQAATTQVLQDRGPNAPKYYWVADDKGFADFVIAAFYLFGPHLISMYFMWFLVLLVSTVCFIIPYGRNLSSLGFLCLVYLGIQLAISCIPLSGGNMPGVIPMEKATIYEPRFLDVLGIIPILHMMFFAWGRQKIYFWRNWVPLLVQTFIFICLYHARSSLGWEIIVVLFFCLLMGMIKWYASKRTLTQKQWSVKPALIVMLVLIASVVGLNVYKHKVYDRAYFHEMGSRTIWHNALMGLSYNPVFVSRYGLTGINDLTVAEKVVEFAKQSSRCSPELAATSGQQLLNTFGNHGTADWKDYEYCAKLLFFKAVSENKLEFIKTFLLTKPWHAIETFLLTNQKWGDEQIDNLRNERNIGWYPFTLANTLFFSLVLFLSFRALTKTRFKLLLMTSVILLFSFIPAILFYGVVLTMGGLLVAAGILFYLLLTQMLNLFLMIFKRKNKCTIELTR